MLVNKLQKYHDELRVLMKLYYWFKSMSGVLNNARPKTTGWLCMCEQNSAKNLIYIRGMYQVNYKRMQIRTLAILSFSSLSLFFLCHTTPDLHHPHGRNNVESGAVFFVLSLSLALSDQTTAVILSHTPYWTLLQEWRDCGRVLWLVSQHL